MSYRNRFSLDAQSLFLMCVLVANAARVKYKLALRATLATPLHDLAALLLLLLLPLLLLLLLHREPLILLGAFEGLFLVADDTWSSDKASISLS